MKELIKKMKSENGIKREWVWENMIPAGGVVMLAGTPKAGKTTLVAQLVAAVSTGDEFLGLGTKKTKVLWLGLEEREQDVAQRFDALGAGKNLRFQRGPLRATLPALEAMRQYSIDEGIGMVVVDTLSKFWGLRDENDAADVDRAMDNILQFARATNTAVLLLHHLRKNPADDGADIRGSSAIFAAMDNAIMLRRDQKSETRRTINCLSRYSETPLRLFFEMKNDGGLRVMHEGEVDAKKTGGLMAALSSTDQDVPTIAKKAGLTDSTARRMLRKAASDGEALRTGTGKKGAPETFRLAEDTPGEEALLGPAPSPAPSDEQDEDSVAPEPVETPENSMVPEAALNGMKS